MSVCAKCRSVVLPEVGGERANFCAHCGTRLPVSEPVVTKGAHLPVADFGMVVLGDVIGQGGMGSVRHSHLFYDPKGPRAGHPGHPVAVKLLHPMLRGRQRARDLFVREATALERLRHPNIVHFHGLLASDHQLGIVMEYVEGQPLSSLIKARRTQHVDHGRGMPFMMAWHYFAQLLGALAAVHDLQIIHRDIKPANVLVRTDGIAKLTDFGIARVPAEEAQNTGGLAPGTGAYMAPEQVRGGELDARSDLYAAGIVLYEMLCGTTPFEAKGRGEMMLRAAQLEVQPEPLSARVEGCPKPLDRVFERALAKDREQRYDSAIALGDALLDAIGVPATEGWLAQKRLAKKARVISQMLPEQAPRELVREADKLRTDAMTAFKQP